LIRRIVLIPHDPNWATLFEEEKNNLYEQLELDLAGRSPHGSDGYTQGKDAFIRDNLQKAEIWRDAKNDLEKRENYGRTKS
jgi:GrpB-like predicted nucleotidyltransferase (UPF0157 family)